MQVRGPGEFENLFNQNDSPRRNPCQVGYIFTESNGVLSGSARSVSGFNIYKALKQCEAEIIQFGGHKYAAGLSVETGNFQNFAAMFEEVVAASIPEEALVPKVKIDAVIELTDVSMKLFNIIEQMAPFGPGNMRPQFIIKKVYDEGGSRIVGQNHLKLSLQQNKSKVISGIAFGMSGYADMVWSTRQEGLAEPTNSNYVDLVTVLDKNVWNGTTSLQLRVKDIRLHLKEN